MGPKPLLKTAPAPVRWLVFLLLAAAAFQVLGAMAVQSPTADEFAHHIASGYSHLVTGDFRMNPAMPPFPRLLSAIPMFLAGAKAPLDHPSWEAGDSPEFARQFFYRANTDMDKLVFLARLPILLVSLVFGFCVFAWASRLFGAVGGLTALALYAFSPDVLTHSGLATSDLTVAFFFFLSFWAFWEYLHEPSGKNLVKTSVFTGLAFLSKFSAVLLFPTFLIIAVAAGKWREVPPKKILLFLAVTFLTVWAGYFFEVKPLLLHTPDPAKKIEFLQKLGGQALVDFAQNAPLPLATFITSIGSMAFTRAQGTNAFLLGEWSRHGWWYYYFLAFFLKNTVPSLIFYVFSFAFLKKLALDRVTAAVLLTPIVFFFLATLPDKSQVGIRYFLPIYPLFFLLAGGAAAYLWKKGRACQLLAAGLLVWHAVSTLMVFPHTLSYFNEFAGGPKNGYKIFRDSNVDWGQDLKGLGEYVRKEKLPEITLFFYGPADPAYYGILYRPIEPAEYETPRKAIYALGVHQIDVVKWHDDHRPVTIIGNSIFVYDFR